MFKVNKGDLDAAGRMRAWHIAKGEWIWKYPIDVQEMMKRGAVTLDAPAEAPPAPTAEPVPHPMKRGRKAKGGNV